MVRYCSECGHEIADTDKFCPYCGATVSDNPSAGPDPAFGYGPGPYRDSMYWSNYKDLTALLLILWGIIAVIDGIASIAAADWYADVIREYAQDSDPDATSYAGLDWDAWRLAYYISGALTLGSGIAALVSWYYTNKGVRYNAAFYGCLVSTILACTGLITLAVGIYVTYRITKCKQIFTS
ncbi:MAG: zinc-ribbon domain-containing protein [Methanomethylophilus sp.]|jgi:hypothetical protein